MAKNEEAVKNKNDDAKFGRFWKIIKEEQPFENWLLGILATLLLIISIYMLMGSIGSNTFAKTYFDVQQSGWWIFNAKWKVITFSSIVMAGCIGSILFVLIPIFIPSFKDLKYVTWPTKKVLVVNSTIVIGFILFCMAIFKLYELILLPLIRWLYGA